mgnify:CR=1 FL=1
MENALPKPHDPPPVSQDLRRQYKSLLRRLGRTDWIAHGSVFERHYTLRVAGKPKRCGPYYCLTRKERGKTRTLALSAEQFRLYRKAIANHRALDQILRQMRNLSLRFIHQSTPGVLSRNRVKPTKSRA